VAAACTAAIGIAWTVPEQPATKAPRTPEQLAALLTGGSVRAVVGVDGRAVKGPDGKPLHVGRDGVLIDSHGRPLAGSDGAPLLLGRGGRLPAVLRAPPDTRGKDRGARQRARKPLLSEEPPIVVGLVYQDAEGANQVATLGGGDLGASDQAAQARAVAAYINATGGIGGRRLTLRLYRDDYSDGSPLDVRAGRICAFFSEGDRPVAVLGAGRRTTGCLAARGILQLEEEPGIVGGATTAFYNRFDDTYFSSTGLAIDRFPGPYTRGLADQGFFANGARVGLLFAEGWDDDNRSVRAMRSALAAVRASPVAEARMPMMNSTNDLPAMFARMENAALRFRVARVNRIVSVDNLGIYLGAFMITAEAQGYRPRYGVSTLNQLNLLRATRAIPVGQFRGAVGVGWSPITDVPASREGPLPAIRSQCATIFRNAGVTLGARTSSGQHMAHADCGNLLLLRRVLAANPAGGGPNDLRIGLERVGTSLPMPTSFSTRLDHTRHDGAAGYRLVRFDQGCACFEYHGRVRETE
jgi:hypothetical protein